MLPESKWYIKHSDQCSICLESITSLKNAYLTQCGHCFHKSCYANHMNYTYNYGVCPNCRQENNYFSFYKYNLKNTNFLDKLENFLLHTDKYILKECNSFHHLGTDNFCLDFLCYRKYG
jgi:hypothetical protein